MKYKLTGKYRKQGAQGKSQPFTREIKASSPKQAMDRNREELYQLGFDHILHTSIAERRGKFWHNIPMLVALGLE